MLREIVTLVLGASLVVVTADLKTRANLERKEISLLEQSPSDSQNSLFKLNQERMFVLIQLLSQYWLCLAPHKSHKFEIIGEDFICYCRLHLLHFIWSRQNLCVLQCDSLLKSIFVNSRDCLDIGVSESAINYYTSRIFFDFPTFQ